MLDRSRHDGIELLAQGQLLLLVVGDCIDGSGAKEPSKQGKRSRHDGWSMIRASGITGNEINVVRDRGIECSDLVP